MNHENKFAPLSLGTTLGQQEFSGYRIVKTNHRRNQVLRPHAHQYPALTLVVAGSFDENVNQTIHRCNKSTALFKPAGSTHSNFYGSNGATSIILEILDWKKFPSTENELPESAITVCSPGFQLIAREFETELDRCESASPRNIQALLMESLGRLIRGYARSRKSKRPPSWLLQAIEYIQSNFVTSLSLQSIADFVGKHPIHLSREMRRYRGQSVGQMICDLRLDKAQDFLLQTQYSVTEIACRLGFADAPHFCRVFKRRFSVTPGEFRGRKTRK